MTTIAVNQPGRLHTWVASQVEGVPAATTAQRHAVIRSFRDTLAVALAGHAEEATRWARSYSEVVGSKGPAAIWGTGQHRDRATAAVVNGTAVQSLEFDDVTPVEAAHLSSVVVPTLAAFADELDGARTIDGIVHGWRVAAALGTLIGFDAHRRGVQPTHTLGPIVAVVAASCGLGLSADQARTALALAALGGVGLRANTGSHAKALQSGLAAGATVRAIEMARLRGGSAHQAGGAVLDSMLGILGADEAQIDRVISSPLPPPTFLAVKPYPTCGAAHPSIEALLAVRARVSPDVRPDRIEVRVPERVPRAMAFEMPKVGAEARWSLRYALATAWETGDADLAEFQDDAVREAAGRRAMPWLEIVGDPTFELRSERAVATVTVGGVTERAEISHRLGYTERPLSDEQVRAKFQRCLTFAGREDLADDLWDGLGKDPWGWIDRV